jgi:hypothetical protein
MSVEEWHANFKKSDELSKLGTAQYSKAEYALNQAQLLDEEHGMAWVRSVFEGRTDFDLNWLFLSVSGIAGSYVSLDDLEEDQEYWDDQGTATITMFVVQPRMGRTFKGNVRITRADIPFLRTTVEKTLAGCRNLQSGNLEADHG